MSSCSVSSSGGTSQRSCLPVVSDHVLISRKPRSSSVERVIRADLSVEGIRGRTKKQDRVESEGGPVLAAARWRTPASRPPRHGPGANAFTAAAPRGLMRYVGTSGDASAFPGKDGQCWRASCPDRRGFTRPLGAGHINGDE